VKPPQKLKKKDMDHTASIAFLLTIRTGGRARSALPDAPVVDDGRARGPVAADARAWLATALHRLAWAVEPDPWTTAAARHAPSSSDAVRC
jgi:hypothetical protein